MNLWQLKKISTNEALSQPQPLPENWGPIFGLHGFIDQLGDLSWLGDAYNDQGWFIVGQAPENSGQSTKEQLEWDRAKKMLQESDWSMLPDVPMSTGDKTAWIEYRRSLREIRLQPGFPENIIWPARPE